MIPLSVPNISGNEMKYVKDCLETGWISTAGSYVDKFEDEFAKYVGMQKAVSTMNGTSALHIALKVMGVGRNDLVIMPNVTFVASANAVSYLGAEPLLIDINPHTWQMDLDLLEEIVGIKKFKKKINFKTYPYLEAQISSISDDIAYNNHDIQDGINANLFK